MNKKFSTLMTAGLLLSGALFCNVDAAPKKLVFHTDSIGTNKVLKGLAEGDTLYFNGKADISENSAKKYFIINTKNVTVLGNKTDTLIGRMVIAAEGVKVKNLIVNTKSENADDNGYWTKTALTAFADAISIDSCKFTSTEAASGTIPNGIVLYPQTDNVAYNLKGNQFVNLNDTVSQWYSSAIQIYKKTKVETKTNDPLKTDFAKDLAAYGKGSGNPVIDGAAIVKDNSFTNCTADLVVRTGNELDASYNVEYAHLSNKVIVTKATSTPLDKSLLPALIDAIKNSISATATLQGSVIVVEGATAQEVVDALTNTANVPVAVQKQLAGQSVAITTQKDGKAAGTVALGGIEVADENVISLVYGENGGSYVAPVVESVASGSQYVLMTSDFKALKAAEDGTATAVAYPTQIASGSTFAKTYKDFLWTLTINKTEGYAKFTNSKGKVLMAAGKAAYIAAPNGEIADLSAIKFKELKDVTGGGGSALTIGSDSLFAIAATPVSPNRMVKASELKAIFGESFYVAIERGGKALANDPFKPGSLKPVVWENIQTGKDVIDPYRLGKPDTTRFMLQDEDGNLLVMKKSEMYATATAGKYAYQLTTVDVETLATAVKTGKSEDYAPYFTIYVKNDNVIGIDEPVEFITAEGEGTGVYKLGSITLKDVNTLAACDRNDDFLDAIDIELAQFGTIDVTALLKSGKYFTIANKNTKSNYSDNFGKVLGLNNYGGAQFMKKSEVLFGYPETQWAITADKDGKTLTLKNREYPKASMTYEASTLYKVEGNTYAIVTSPYPYDRDTIEIVAVKDPKATDGFKHYDASKLKDQLFYIGSYSSVRDTVYVAENHKKDHQVGLVADKADATAWRMLPLLSQEEDAWNNPVKGTMTPTTICIVSDVNDGLGKTKKDTLEVQAYAFMNIENGEYMAYSNSRDRFVTGYEKSTTGYTGNGDANYFAVKIMGDSTRFNLVAIQQFVDGGISDVAPDRSNGDKGYNYLNDLDSCVYVSTNAYPMQKIYAGESNEGILNRYSMYQQNESDLFTITEKAAPEYLSLNQGDVIKIYRAEYAASESNVLYEKSGFLGMGNAVETPKINPAIYVDPIDGSTDHPEYLLGLNARKVDATYECNEPSHSDLYHTTDTVFARYLVNLADSALAEDMKEDVHINKYVYNDGGWDYAKLAFVEGYCADDSLVYIKDQATGKYGEPMLITEAPQLFKFAFRVVDPETKSFVVETAYKELNYDDDEVENGYLRYINGNVVVTNEIKEAEVFNLKEDSRDPVANETIAASAISVVTKEGAVVIKGAAGKNVVITNVLGQTIANTVLTSDEATIAAPAGVIVVAVEGEAAVKAIVK